MTADDHRPAATRPTRSVARLWHSISFALLALVAVASGTMLLRHDRMVRAERHKQLESIADERRAAIEHLLAGRLADATVFASFPSVREALTAPTPAPGGEATQHLVDVLEVGRTRWESLSVAIVDSRHEIRVGVGRELSAELLRALPQLASGVDLVGPDGNRQLVFLSPVTSSRHARSPLGWVVLVDDPATALWPILLREPVITETGESLLSRIEGDRLAFLSPLRFRVAGDLSTSDAATSRLPAMLATRGEIGVGEFVDYRGQRVLAALRRIERTGWGLVVKVDRSESLLGEAREHTWAAIALLSLTLGLLTLVRAVRTSDRLAASEEGRLREERHRLVLEQVRDAVVWLRPGDGRILEANLAAEALWGYSREELLQLTASELRVPDERGSAAHHLAKAQRDGDYFSARHRRRDGSTFPVDVSSRRVQLDGSEVLVAVVRDTTEREAAVERILLLNRLLRTISSVNQVLVEVRDRARLMDVVCQTIVRDGDFTMAWIAVPDSLGRLIPAASAGRVDGYFDEVRILTTDELLGQSPAGTAFCERRATVVEDWETDPRLEPFRDAGRKRGFRSSAACPILSHGEAIAVLGLYSDRPAAFVPEIVALLEELAGDLGLALDLATADERLRQSEARYRDLFDSNPAPMWVYDLETLRFVAVNDAAVATYGYSREEFLSLTLRDIRPEEDLPALEANLQSTRPGLEVSGPWRHRRRDGSIVTVDIRSHDVAFSGRACRLVLVTDVTERLRAEEEIRQLNASLEARVESRTVELVAKSRELEAFAYSVSHDLRAPLRAIDGFSRMLEEDHASQLDAEGTRLLAVVRQSANRMGLLIDDLLSFSRAGRHEIQRVPVEVTPLVRGLLDELLPADERERTEIVLGELPEVSADPALLRQVFVNLLSNAIKFSAGRERRRIEVTGDREGSWASFQVRDNGVGFDMRYASKLFGVFQRLHGREFEGTGVGLALVQRIVERHGGKVGAEGVVDRGATFTIQLPVSGDAA